MVDRARSVLEEPPGAPVLDGQDLGHDGPPDLFGPIPPEVKPGRPVHHLEVLGPDLQALCAESVQDLVQPGPGSEHPDVASRGPQESRQMLLNADVMPEATKWRSSGGMLPSKFKAMGKSRSDGLK